MNMNFKRKLPIPMEIKEQYPITYELEQMKEKRDQEIKSIFEGRDDRFILIIGPCSADSPEPVLEYISRLKEVQEEVKDKIFIIPRIFFNKINDRPVNINFISNSMFNIIISIFIFSRRN